MTTKELYEIIEIERPPVIYLTGKTSTGKTTFATQVQKELNYEALILDDIVVDTIVKPLQVEDDEEIFFDIYRTGKNPEWTKRFVEATREILAQALTGGRRVIVEGALARNEVLTAIFRDYSDFQFVYFHPANLESYRQYLTNRFKTTNQRDKAGLPAGFWSLVDPQAFGIFCKNRIMTTFLHNSIRRYAAFSQQQSSKRLAMFREAFDNIIVVEI